MPRKPPARRCSFCHTPLPADARVNQKYCDADCRRGRKKPKLLLEQRQPGPVEQATEQAIAEAVKERRLGPLDIGAIAAMRVLARKVDEEQERWDYALAWSRSGEHDDEKKSAPKPPPVDNVSIPTYLRYAESLGLTPAGRKNQASPNGERGAAAGGSRVAGLAGSIPRPA